MPAPPRTADVVRSLHSSGLVALVDAAGLAAIIGACEDDRQFEGITPSGAAASLDLHRPAQGRLLATCRLDRGTQRALRPVLSGRRNEVRIRTRVDIVDERQAVVCRGRFNWYVHRTGFSRDRARSLERAR